MKQWDSRIVRSLKDGRLYLVESKKDGHECLMIVESGMSPQEAMHEINRQSDEVEFIDFQKISLEKG